MNRNLKETINYVTITFETLNACFSQNDISKISIPQKRLNYHNQIFLLLFVFRRKSTFFRIPPFLSRNKNCC